MVLGDGGKSPPVTSCGRSQTQTYRKSLLSYVYADSVCYKLDVKLTPMDSCVVSILLVVFWENLEPLGGGTSLKEVRHEGRALSTCSPTYFLFTMSAF